MTRREFITLFGGAATMLSSLSARAQQGEHLRRIGVLLPNTVDDPQGQARLASFRASARAIGLD